MRTARGGTPGRRKTQQTVSIDEVSPASPLADHRPQLQGPSAMNTFESNRNLIQVAALRYAQLGLTPIPLRSNSKAPYLHSWPRLKTRTLLKHFRPDDNLGLRLGRQETGNVIIAIDVDSKNNGQLSTLVQNRSWPHTAEAITPSGGQHYLLTLPAGLTARTRLGLVRGIDLLGQGSLIVAEPSSVDGREYVWLRHPQQGIAVAPEWLVADLRRGGLVTATGLPNARRARTAQNTARWPQGPSRAKEGPRRARSRPPVRHEPLLASALRRFPVSGPGQRNRQLHRLICSLVCRGIAPSIIHRVSLAWWEHFHALDLCRDPPNQRQVDSHISSACRAYFRGQIAAPAMLDPDSIQAARSVAAAALSRALPPSGGGNGGADGGEKVPRWGRKERSFVAALLLHFYRAALLSHPLGSTYPATNGQLIEKMEMEGENLESKQFRRLKEKFISRGNQPATKMELLLCVREGYRTRTQTVPSLYEFTKNFTRLLEEYVEVQRAGVVFLGTGLPFAPMKYRLVLQK